MQRTAFVMLASLGWTAASAQGVVTSAPAPAATPAAWAGSEPSASAPKEKMVCRTEDTIGTLLGGHRECHTKAEWAAMARDSRREFEQNNRPLGAPH